MASGGGGDESRREGPEGSWVPSLYNDDFDSDSDVVPVPHVPAEYRSDDDLDIRLPPVESEVNLQEFDPYKHIGGNDDELPEVAQPADLGEDNLAFVESALPSDPSPPPSPPPSPHSCGTTPTPETPPPRDEYDPTNYEKEVEGDKYDQKLEEVNKSAWRKKPLTKWVMKAVVKKSQRPMYEENTEQVKIGIEAVEALTEPALNKFFEALTRCLPYIVFGLSLVLTIIDFIWGEDQDAKFKKDNKEGEKYENENRGFSYGCFTLVIIDLTLLSINVLLPRCMWYKNKSEIWRQNFEKRQQLIDNILAEVLLYPAILCSVIGLVTIRILRDKDYDQYAGIRDMILVTFDFGSIIYVYVSRMYILKKFMDNLDLMFPGAQATNTILPITSRILYTCVLNAILFGVMLVMLGLQLYHENLDPEDITDNRQKVTMTYTGGAMLVATIVVPIYSIIVFILANYYYVLELFIKINIEVLRKKDSRDKLLEHGEVAEGVMNFAKKNVHATPGRLRDIQSLSTFKRVFYVIREWWIDLLFFVWAAILVGYCILFAFYYAEHVSVYKYLDNGIKPTELEENFSVAYVCCFMVCVTLFILGNYHSFAVVFVTIIIMIPLFLSFAVQAVYDKCRDAKNGNNQGLKPHKGGIHPWQDKDTSEGKDHLMGEDSDVESGDEEPPPEDKSVPHTSNTSLMSGEKYSPTIRRPVRPKAGSYGPEFIELKNRLKTYDSFGLSMASVEVP